MSRTRGRGDVEEGLPGSGDLGAALIDSIGEGGEDFLGLGDNIRAQIPTKPSTFFICAGVFTFLAGTSFATGTGLLFHEHLNQRRVGIYWLSDALLLLGTFVLAPAAMFALHKGFSALKHITSTQTVHTFGASLNYTDTGQPDTELKKPLCNLASRVFKAGAITSAIIGLAVSAYAVIDENMRMDSQVDKEITNYTKEMLILGGVFVGLAIVLGVMSATQKVWELKNSSFNVPDSIYDTEQQSLARRVFIDPTPLPSLCCKR